MTLASEQTGPQTSRPSRQSTASYDKNLCFFCQTAKDNEPVHAIQSRKRGEELHQYVSSCDIDIYKVYLSAAINPSDALAIDVKYHRLCWMKRVLDWQQQPASKTCAVESEIAATVEFLNLIKSLLQCGNILSIKDAHDTFMSVLRLHGCKSTPCRKTVRNTLTENIPDIEFIAAVRKWESDRFCMTAAKIEAVEASMAATRETDQMDTIYQCAKLVRSDILDSEQWEFNGSLDPDVSDIIPVKLLSLLEWILKGVATDLKTQERTEDVTNSAKLLSQQIMFQVKTRRHTSYKPTATDSKDCFRLRREYPLQVGTGILVHQQFRSKSLIDYLHDIGVSVNHARILRIETQLAQQLLHTSAEHGTYVPPSLTKNTFVFFSADNSDFQEDTPEGKNTLHATAMAVFQPAGDPGIVRNINLTGPSRHRSLPLGPGLAVELLPCHIPANTRPPCGTYDPIPTSPSQEVMGSAASSDLTWLVGQSLVRTVATEQKIPTWSAYNSTIRQPTHQLTNVTMMPLIAAPAHEWSTMLTVLKQAQKITTVVMGEGHKTVITFDLQLYEKAVKLQMHIKPELDHMIFRIGEMHTVMASLRALGTSIEDSGIDDSWLEADLYSPQTVRQILESNHMKRALTAHAITTSALSDLYLAAMLDRNSGSISENSKAVLLDLNAKYKNHHYEQLYDVHQELVSSLQADGLQEKIKNFDDEMEPSRPMFKFTRDYMRFVGWIWMFIRASREANWQLHLESLRALCKYLFVYDRQKYARMVPLYLAQMQKLEIEDPYIYDEFMAGNFSVNKSTIPFCTIGPDHAIEHENRVMKVCGGLKGITQQPAAMARWFLIAPELSRLASEAQKLAGSTKQLSVHHHDLSDAVILTYEQNVTKLEAILQLNNPFTSDFHEVHIIFDRYDISNSLKERTRTIRQGGQRNLTYQISDDAIIEKVTLKQLLGTNTSKENLAIYLASKIKNYHTPSGTSYVTTSKEHCISNNLPLEHLESSQEEADTRMILHALDAVHRGATSISIHSSDTDVLDKFPELCPLTSMVIGTGSKRRTVDIAPIHAALGPLASPLPGFHALTGCDQTGTFCGKSKVSCWKALKIADTTIIEALGNLGETQDLSNTDVRALEAFTCQIYMPNTKITSVAEMRWHLFSKRQFTDEKLPPTKAALEQKIKRSNYVTLSWKQAGEAKLTLPPPMSHG